MKKKDLLARLPKHWPDHNTARVIRVDGKKVLMVLLPNWQKSSSKNVYSRKLTTGIAHFVYDTGYQTYYPKEDIWTKESFGWLESESHLTESGFDDKDNERIKKFTGSYYYGYGIKSYESSINLRNKMRYEQNKQNRINEFMKSTPRLPKNFKAWCKKRLGKESEINIKLMQNTDSGVIARMFKIERYNAKEPDIRITEICRAYMRTPASGWLSWYYGEHYYSYGKDQRFWDRRGFSVVNVMPNKYYLYDNLDELDLSPAQKSTMRILDGITDPEWVAMQVYRMPDIEHLAKVGAKRLAVEVMDSTDPATRLKRIGCLPKNQFKRLGEVDGGLCTWELLKVFPKITDKNLKEFAKIKDHLKARDILYFAEEKKLNLNHLFTLWKNTGGIKIETLLTYKDYIEMAETRGCDIHDELIYRDKKWRQRHDEYVEEINRLRAEEEEKKQELRAGEWKGIKKDYKRNTRIFGWEKDNYIITVPKTYKDINQEGREQHHCVGSVDRYKDEMAIRQSYIVFLRKKDKPEKPYYTIQVDERQVLQYYAEYDRQPDKENVKELLDEWMVQVRKNFAKENKKKVCATSHRKAG